MKYRIPVVVCMLVALSVLVSSPASGQDKESTAATAANPLCKRRIRASVTALSQPFFLNRLGAAKPNGMVFALDRDTTSHVTLPKPGAPTATAQGTKGSTTYTYFILAEGAGGAISPISAAGTVTNGNATLSGANFNHLTWTPLAGAVSYTVLRGNTSVWPAYFTIATGVTTTQADDKGQPVVPYVPSAIQLRSYKRARPMVLRADVGDCLQIAFTDRTQDFTQSISTNQLAVTTPQSSLHIQGLELVDSILDDASYNGANPNSLADNRASKTYTYYAKADGTFLLTTQGGSSVDQQKYASNNNAQLLAANSQLLQGLFGAVNVEPAGAEWYRSQVAKEDLDLATTGHTPDGHPVINYDALYPADYDVKHPGANRSCAPILKMVDERRWADFVDNRWICKHDVTTWQIYYTDLTAIITGPNHGNFPPQDQVKPIFRPNPAYPDRTEAYREVTSIYHEVPDTVQAFPFIQNPSTYNVSMPAGPDLFAINYGANGIASEIYANRIGVGPEGGCVDCKFEEFFLSSWSVGDPAMVVDRPANVVATGAQVDCRNDQYDAGGPPCAGTRNPATGTPYTMTPIAKATEAFYPDDPSNVYHSYVNDHLKFRILHGGTGLPHVHHQHAHQWLASPNSDDSSYLDSQMISPGGAYTLEMVYNGSGNRNKTVGDSIFHCHFYPHFASGMWALWRVHDVFEAGTQLDSNGRPTPGARALPDAEIAAGTPIPAVVPIPTVAMAPMPAKIQLCAAYSSWNPNDVVRRDCPSPGPGASIVGRVAIVDPDDLQKGKVPGYPFFIPGIGGGRPPHPPLDFAPKLSNTGVQDKDANGNLAYWDGGLPRHIITQGKVSFEKHDTTDWSKDLTALVGYQLPEDGTSVEKATMKAYGNRYTPSYLPNGTRGFFVLNGLPKGPQHGAPFADPAVDDDGNAIGSLRTYKAAVFETDVPLNSQGWHYPQQRILSLWGDVIPTVNKAKTAEPLFFRANSEDVVEYWHTDLVPNYYKADAFQVRTPTDVIGQHIHLVKFDVLASDGAANGFNYEDGTLAADEVQDLIAQTKPAQGGRWIPLPGGPADLQAQAPPPEICVERPGDPRECPKNSSGHYEWDGAQTTIQRWYVDPLMNNVGDDRTLRTVFTHDHFSPSTHQQVGLYAGLVAEPSGSEWTLPDGTPMYTRDDGGPTSYAANIITRANVNDSYREFLLEFQDMQLAYSTSGTTKPVNQPNNSTNPHQPQLISNGLTGTFSINYRNVTPRMANANLASSATGYVDPAFVFSSSYVPKGASSAQGDPGTPLLQAYQNDNVQVRVLVGAHLQTHFFTMTGLKWLQEPSWKNSGYRSSQGMGISEHFEMLFKAPNTTGPKSTPCPDSWSQQRTNVACADYFYNASSDDNGLTSGGNTSTGGIWGLLRAYNPNLGLSTPDTSANSGNQDPPGPLSVVTNKPLQPLPNNVSGGFNSPESELACPPPNVAPRRQYNVTAVNVDSALDPKLGLVFYKGKNPAGKTVLLNLPKGLMFVRSEDLNDKGQLKPNVSVEPLILRADAGECVQVTVTNGLNMTNSLFGGSSSPSYYVGLTPQLLSFNITSNSGSNIGYNPNQTVAPCNPNGQDCTNPSNWPKQTYSWYGGAFEATPGGPIAATPVEFGGLNLFPSDMMLQHEFGMVGAMVIEPERATWKEDQVLVTNQESSFCLMNPSDPQCQSPVSRASAIVSKVDRTSYREFVAMVQDDVLSNFTTLVNPPTSSGASNDITAVNYGTEPMDMRYIGEQVSGTVRLPVTSYYQAASNSLVKADPHTPVFTASAGMPVRFHWIHPGGLSSYAITLNGHVWERQPYVNDSRQIGNNTLSEWIGSRDDHGPTDLHEMVIEQAGGSFKIPGDYMYATFVSLGQSTGLWGLFRVGNECAAGICPDTVSVMDVSTLSQPLNLNGVNTVQPSTGTLARQVQVYAGTNLLGSASVLPNGTWSFICTSTACAQAPVLTIKSSLGGQASVTRRAPLLRTLALPPAERLRTPEPDPQDIFRKEPRIRKPQ